MNDLTLGWAELLICPSCQNQLGRQSQDYFCETCDKLYPIVDGVTRFSPPDEFYEGRYAVTPANFRPDETSLTGKASLYYYSQHYLWYIRQHIPQGSHILDVAGGAGIPYLTQHWHVAGLEVSAPHARAMAQNYELALCANALDIPLEDHSLDAVISRFFLEHVSPDNKLKLVKEFHRVLKPGGWLITMQDCESNNPLWRWARHDPELFQARFIENDGHYGLMYASENLDLFRQAGFQVHSWHAPNKTPFVTLSMLEWMQPYRSKAIWANVLLGAGHIVYRNRWLTQAYNVTMTIWDDLVERLLPLDHARYLLAVCKKG
jgi:SAM-dependent methyltransferase